MTFIIPHLFDSRISTAQEYIELLKKQQAGIGNIKAETANLIEIEQEKLLAAQKYYDLMVAAGNALESNKALGEIYKIKGSILDLQKTMRENLEDEYNKMEMKMINAPRNIAQQLAKSGVEMWRQQLDMSNKAISLPKQQAPVVNVYLNKDKFHAEIEEKSTDVTYKLLREVSVQ